jgi:hypothetical protein
MRPITIFVTLLGFTTLAAVALPRNAAACRGQTWHQSIFFEAVPSGELFNNALGPSVDLTTATILRVTILSTTLEKPWLVLGQARVDEVIQGQVDSTTLTIRMMESSCGPWMGAGNQGIVIGTLTRTPTGEAELVPVSEAWGVREKRLKAGESGGR